MILCVDEWGERGRGYLNTASYGLPPQRARSPAGSARRLARRRDQLGAAGGRRGRGTWGLFARLVGAAAEDVALGEHGVAARVPRPALPDGARVLVPDIEFTSILFPWLVQGRRGVDVRYVAPSRLVDEIDEQTDLVAFSAVQSATGEVGDVAEVARVVGENGALVVVDATQAAGWLPVDAAHADLVVCAAYKWLLAPRGAAFMVVGLRLAEAAGSR